MKRNALVLLTGVALATAALLGSGREEVLASPAKILSLRFAPVPCTGYCVVCAGGPGHVAFQVSCPECTNKDASQGDQWHDECQASSNCSGHQCSESSPSPEEVALTDEALFNQVSAAHRSRNGAELRRLMRANPRRLHFVATRSAVQITACDGAVIAHYPVGDTKFSDF